MSPGCMLLLVFGFVGGAVVVNSAVLVSLSVLLLVHYSVSGRLPAITHSLPGISRYVRRGSGGEGMQERNEVENERNVWRGGEGRGWITEWKRGRENSKKVLTRVEREREVSE